MLVDYNPIIHEKLFTPELKLYSPNVLLSGHNGEIYTGKFSNEGFLYATAGHDKSIFLWETFEENCRNITTLKGHTNAILELKWSNDDSKIYSCSADKTVSIWDVYESKRIKKLKGHESFVNSLDVCRKNQDIVIYLFIADCIWWRRLPNDTLGHKKQNIIIDRKVQISNYIC